MDGSDYETLKHNTHSESALVTEPFNAEPYLIASSNPGRRKIIFGNSGLRVVCDMYERRYVADFHFEPEDKDSSVDENNPKYVSFLGSAFLKLHELLNDPKTLKDWGLEAGKFGKCVAVSNHPTVKAVARLFSGHKADGLVSVSDQNTTVSVDLNKLRLLNADDPQIVYLKRLADRAKSNTATYYKNKEHEE